MISMSDTTITLRQVEADDADTVARIVYEAFAAIHDRHRFPRDFPTLEAADALVGSFIANPSIWGVVAEDDGVIVGSNFVDERGPVRGVGPITVDPQSQQRGVGRQLMAAALERSSGAAGVRLLQDSFNVQSLGLYASLGFEATEPVVVMGGRPRTGVGKEFEVRPMTERDIDEADLLHREVHGFQRATELRDALDAPAFEPHVATSDGEIVAYATTLTFFAAAHAVARSDAAMAALIAGTIAAGEAPASFLLPVRRHELFNWALQAGLRVVKPMTYMVIGQPHDPRGSWIPSVLY
jgi:predicted N-acetyltransferase YhbS